MHFLPDKSSCRIWCCIKIAVLKWSVITAASRAGAQAGKRMAHSAITVKCVQDIGSKSIVTGREMGRSTAIFERCLARA